MSASKRPACGTALILLSIITAIGLSLPANVFVFSSSGSSATTLAAAKFVSAFAGSSALLSINIFTANNTAAIIINTTRTITNAFVPPLSLFQSNLFIRLLPFFGQKGVSLLSKP